MNQRRQLLVGRYLPSKNLIAQVFTGLILSSAAYANPGLAENFRTKTSLNSATVLDKTIKGKITDDKGEGLPGVSVVLKGSTTGTVTDTEGTYSLNTPDQGGTLIFSSVGYLTQEVAISGKTTIDIKLAADAKALSEVVVVGYGSQLKKEITGAVQTIKADEIKDMPVSQVTQKLQGKLAGVQINQTTGKPGQGMSIRIRGQLSVSAGSDPLYVIDGFPITGSIGNMNPDEIEDITILKDAASTSLYGSRAANGVVLITTKKSTNGKTNIGLNVYAGTQNVPDRGLIKMLTAEEFAQFKKESYEDMNQPVPDVFQDPSQYKGKNNDWYHALLRRAPLQSYNLTVTTNTEKSSTSVVAGVFNQQGVVLNNAYKRYSLRINNEYRVSNKVKLGFNIAPSYIFDNTPKSDGDRGTGILFNALHTWPIMPIYDANGNLTTYNNFPGNTGNIFSYPNWVRAAQQLINETKKTGFLGNAYAAYTPIKGLTFKTSFNTEFLATKFYYFNPSTATYQINVPIPTTASSIRSNTQNFSWLNENTVTYNKSLGEHNFELLAGFTKQKVREEMLQVSASVYPDDRVTTPQSAINIARGGGTSSAVNQYTLSSYLSRLTYNFKGKYLFTAAVRADGSSRFGADNRWGVFPSASVGWVISDEDFLKNNIKQVSFAKVRSSYGVIGNNNIGNYTQYATVDNTINSVFGANVAPGAAITSLANRNLGWEKTKQFDLGLDLGLFNDRITFVYDFYTKRTTNLLYSVQIAQEAGFGNYNDNIGEIKFWGHEFSLTTRNTVGQVKWTTNANISFNRNKVLALSDGIDRVYGDVNITQVGKPFGQFYGLIKDGYYTTQEQLKTTPVVPGRSAIGVIRYKDLNGDGVITNGGDKDDRTVIGNPFPKFTYGITNTVAYKNFDLSITGSGSQGNQLYVQHLYSTANLDGVFNMVAGVKDRFRVKNAPDPITGAPVATTIITEGKGQFGATNNGGNYTGLERDWASTQFLANASYFTIKNVTLGYNIGIKNKIFKSARLYASVQQLYVFTKYWGGPNPETSGQPDGNGPGNNLSLGRDYSNYPVPRTWTVGINLNF